MTDMRHYQRSTVLAAARDLVRRRERGEINHLDYVLELNCYRLRDRDGAYWFLNPATERWYRFEGGEWRTHGTAPDVLEGPNLLSFLAARGKSYEPREPVEPQGLTAAQALAAIVGEIRSGYDDGTLSSSDARNLLARQVMIDLDGNFWTMGIRSKRWYRFSDRRWHRSDHPPPAEDRLFHMKAGERRCASCGTAVASGRTCPDCGSDVVQAMPDPPEGVARALPEFLLFGVTMLPESIAEPWEPPLEFPDEVVKTTGPLGARVQAPVPRRCPACGAAVKLGQKFCTKCGARITVPEPAPGRRSGSHDS